MSVTHDVLNQASPLADVNLFQLNLPLQEARAWHRPRYDPAVFSAFCASRLDGAADVFGLLPAGTDFDVILQRALPTLN